MKEKSSNNNIIIIAVVAVVAIVAAVLLIVKPFDKKDDNQNNQENSQQSASSRVSKDELKKTPDVTVEFGDYEGMKTLSKDIQNGYATGKIVTIEGTVNHPMTMYSIVQKNESGSQSIGTNFIIDDMETADYPKDKERIKITAKVVETDTLNFQLVTLKEFVEKK